MNNEYMSPTYKCFCCVISFLTFWKEHTKVMTYLLSPNSGKVFVNGKVVNKAGTPISESSVVEIMAEVPKYVCR